MTITYIEGDATKPEGAGPHFVVHVCNDAGTWGAGFVTAVTKRWKQPQAQYTAWKKRVGRNNPLPLGQNQFVRVEENVWVVNMIAQNNFGYGRWGQRPLRYAALTKCLTEVADAAAKIGATVHMPRIGCGIAGGHWNQVGALVEEIMTDVPVVGGQTVDVSVVVYDYNPPKPKALPKKGGGQGVQATLPTDDWDGDWAGAFGALDADVDDFFAEHYGAGDGEEEGGLYGAGAYGSYIKAATEEAGPTGKPIMALVRIAAEIPVEVAQGEWDEALAGGPQAVRALLNKHTSWVLADPEVYAWQAGLAGDAWGEAGAWEGPQIPPRGEG